jgi:predicted nucleic acid-binding protein
MLTCHRYGFSLSIDSGRPAGVIDAYLLALAVNHEGRLVTFEHAIARRVVPGAEERHPVVL